MSSHTGLEQCKPTSLVLMCGIKMSIFIWLVPCSTWANLLLLWTTRSLLQICIRNQLLVPPRLNWRELICDPMRVFPATPTHSARLQAMVLSDQMMWYRLISQYMHLAGSCTMVPPPVHWTSFHRRQCLKDGTAHLKQLRNPHSELQWLDADFGGCPQGSISGTMRKFKSVCSWTI